MKQMEMQQSSRNTKKHICRSSIRIAGVTALCMSLMLTGCGQKKQAEEEKNTDILVEVATPQTGNIALQGEFMGTVEADTDTNVIPKASGEVTKTFFEVGDSVKAGDLLLTIDDAAAQISMRQAQASLTSSQATYQSAQVSEQAAEVAKVYSDAQIKEALGTADTDQMKLQNAVSSTKYALKAAQENNEYYKENYANIADNYDDLEDNIDSLKDSAENMDDYKDSLESYADLYEELAGKSSTADAWSLIDSLNARDAVEDVNSNCTSAEDIAKAYIKAMTDADTYYELETMIAETKSSISSTKSSRESSISSKDSLLLSRFQAAIQKETGTNAVNEAEDAEALAEKTLQDYLNFTKATVIAKASSDQAASTSSLASAQAAVTSAQANVSSSQATVDSAKLQLEYTQVKAPVSGVITQKNISTHDMASSASAAYVISSSDSKKITFYVSESTKNKFHQGQKTVIERNDKKYDGNISEIGNVVDETTGLFKIKSTIADDASDLVTGTSVKITTATDQADNVMTIPVDCINYESEVPYVYVMKDGKAVRTEIETTIADDSKAEVTSGLSTTDQVITSWSSQLTNNVGVYTEKAKKSASTKETSKKAGAAQTIEETTGSTVAEMATTETATKEK